jgi:hypothetical protein
MESPQPSSPRPAAGNAALERMALGLATMLTVAARGVCDRACGPRRLRLARRSRSQALALVPRRRDRGPWDHLGRLAPDFGLHSFLVPGHVPARGRRSRALHCRADPRLAGAGGFPQTPDTQSGRRALRFSRSREAGHGGERKMMEQLRHRERRRGLRLPALGQAGGGAERMDERAGVRLGRPDTRLDEPATGCGPDGVPARQLHAHPRELPEPLRLRVRGASYPGCYVNTGASRSPLALSRMARPNGGIRLGARTLARNDTPISCA